MLIEHIESGLNDLLFAIDNEHPTMQQITNYLNALHAQCIKQGIAVHHPANYFRESDIQLHNDFINSLPKEIQFPFTLPPVHLKLLLDSCLVPRVCQFTNHPINTFAEYIAWVKWRYDLWMQENPDLIPATRKNKQTNAEYMRGYRQRKKQELLESNNERGDLERRISLAYQEFKQACADRDAVVKQWTEIVKEKQNHLNELTKLRKK